MEAKTLEFHQIISDLDHKGLACLRAVMYSLNAEQVSGRMAADLRRELSGSEWNALVSLLRRKAAEHSEDSQMIHNAIRFIQSRILQEVA